MVTVAAMVGRLNQLRQINSTNDMAALHDTRQIVTHQQLIRYSQTKIKVLWTMNASNNDNTDTHKFSDFPSSNEYTRMNGWPPFATRNSGGGNVFRTDRAAIPDTQIATLTCMWEQSSCSSRRKVFVL